MLLILLKRRLQRWWHKAPWLTLFALLSVLYAVGYLMMLWREPAGSQIRSLASYTYFFVITVTTVGFGDIVPVSSIGRLTAAVIAVGGIGAAAVALGNVFASIGNYMKRRERGLLSYVFKGHASEHTYLPPRGSD